MANELIAIAFVVDSSLALESEWLQIKQDYLTPLMARLGETYGIRIPNNATPNTSNFRVAVVTYSTSDTYPTPLLMKVPFGPASILKDFGSTFKLGQSKGSQGMAALEGLVAAIEVN